MRFISLKRLLGWKSGVVPAGPWAAVVSVAAGKGVRDIVLYFAQTEASPRDITREKVDAWRALRVSEGVNNSGAVAKARRFWKLLADENLTSDVHAKSPKYQRFALPMSDLPPLLKEEVEAIVKWRTAEFALGRSKKAKVRVVTALGFQRVICQIAGFAASMLGDCPSSMMGLITPAIIEPFIDWRINDRGLKGLSVEVALAAVVAALSQHPAHRTADFKWIRTIIDSLPEEHDSVRRGRKSAKFIEYGILAQIPGQLAAKRQALERLGEANMLRVARMAVDELIFRWLLVLPWRQRNLREMRVAGARPNLFKAKIAQSLAIYKPEWVHKAEAKDPATTFWQVAFHLGKQRRGCPFTFSCRFR